MRLRTFFPGVLVLLAVCALCAVPALAQSSQESGKLNIHVNPKQAYVFVDGKAIRDGSQTIELPAGSHSVGVYNYGYQSKSQSVNVDAKKTTRLDVELQATGAKVPGPFGEIEIKGDPRAAVLLNGTTPDYFVGHVDEFNWDWIWHQRLLLKPGTYQMTVTRNGNTIWSGPVTSKAGEHVTVYLDKNGKTKTQPWLKGEKIGPLPRFTAGIASATVPVAPVTAELAAQPADVGCGQSADLKWDSTDAVGASITGVGDVPPSGNREVTPTQTVTYQITAKGPGGVVTRTVKVKVDKDPAVTLNLSQPEVHFHKVGDKIVQDDPATLNWAASNANSVSITPFGGESMSGSKTIEAEPNQTTTGPVDQYVAYTLTSTNSCGGTTTRTAKLHVIGSIDPAPSITLASLFYPTEYPTPKHPKLGLVAGETDTLSAIAVHFKNYVPYNEKADLVIVGHADERGPSHYNLSLSERRAILVKDYLVSQGIAADKIQIRAEGKREELSKQQVSALQAKDPEKPEPWMAHRTKSTWLAYNRRVDIVLEPAGEQSTEAFPNDAPNARIVWQRPEPNLKKVEMAAQAKIAGGSMHAGMVSN
ncbi:MAG: OmpA family protein [Candidatus Acidiferrales bacterium]